jgi:hypothetical protein
VVYTNGALDEKERGLIFRIHTEYYPSYVHYAVTLYKGSIDARVKAALKLGFIFEDEIERRKWKNGKSFSMYRKSIKVDGRLAKEKQEKLEDEVAARIQSYAQVLKMPGIEY